MKLNGKNIINAHDIDTTELGGNLVDILKKLEEDLTKLKSNVKWLYKYGGVGSGSGGSGTGGNNKWYIIIEIAGNSYTCQSHDNSEASKESLVLNGAGTYTCNIQVMRPLGGSFSATIKWHNGTSFQNILSALTPENGWLMNQIMYIGGNNTITINVNDGEYSAICNIAYITNPYIFKFELSDKDGNNEKSSGTDVFINTIQTAGLMAKLSYNIGVDVAEDSAGNKNGVTYTYVDILGETKKATLDLSKGNNGFILLPLCDDPEYLLNDDNSALYNISIGIDVALKSGGSASHLDMDLSFNLIPSNLYLKIVPDSGTIYNIALPDYKDSENIYTYFTGAKSFAITPYYGVPEGRKVTISIYVDGVLKLSGITVTERETLTGRYATVDIINNTDDTTVEEHIIRFHASVGSASGDFVYYLYARNMNSTLKWYPETSKSELLIPSALNYWRNAQELKNIELADGVAYEMTTTGDPLIFSGLTTAEGRTDLLFAVGIQYSEINSDNSPIFSIYSSTTAGTSDTGYINVYYDKVIITSSEESLTGNTCEVYLNKTLYTNYELNSTEYHLYTLYRRLVQYDADQQRPYYEFIVYIDGVMEGAMSEWLNNATSYNAIKFHPGNYFINHIELSYYEHDIVNGVHNNQYLNDANIVRYWYTYAINKLQKELSDNVLNVLTPFETNTTLLPDDKYYNITSITSDALETIAKNSEVPVIKFNVTDYASQISFLDWFTDTSYSEELDIISKSVSVEYSPGKQALTAIDAVTYGCAFQIDIQGSTTRQYRSKNLELSVRSTDNSDAATYVYSPNFDGTNTNTYLPESSFTLKADAVDSSHSNNTTMGDFVNNNTTPFYDALQSLHQYGKYIKNCLIGYACLVFVEVSYNDVSGKKPDIYYLGVYNFNLGRKSYFNLGYIDLNKLSTALNIAKTNSVGLDQGFNIYRIENTNKLDKFCAAEITGNNPRYDFSQYDESILFRSNDAKDKFAMFDDIETGMIEGAYKQSLQKMVESVAKAGHWIFKTVGKNFGSYEEGYNAVIPGTTISKNQVPDFTLQYTRIINTQGNSEFIPKINKIPDGTSSDWNKCINSYENSDLRIDYNSLVEYYTICMVFGLFDSVLKNLNVKTWNATKYYTAFYDMDTCLGVDNAGENASYYAFSDYWESTETEVETEDGEVLIRPNAIKIYRDYCPDDFKGFDIPSSYLFAIAKYSKLFENTSYDHADGETPNLNFPNELWAKWRRSDGELRNAEYFIANYYQHHLNGVNELMFNYNYRTKYFMRGSSNGNALNSFDTTNFKKFKGRRLEYVRQWLSGRFHLLDAYFNLPCTINPFEKLDLTTGNYSAVQLPGGNGLLSEAFPNSLTIDSNNPDIYVIHSIFGDQQRFQNTIDLVVKSSAYSPFFIIPSGGNVTKYLLVDNDTLYNVYSQQSGNNAINIAGSSNWTYLRDINSFSGSLNISSRLLTELYGNSGNISQFTIDMPSIKTVYLTSPLYSGNLNFGTSVMAPNISSINLTNTSLQLTVDTKPSLQEVIFNNSNGGSINIDNCVNLKNISLNGNFNQINIANVPISLTLNSIKTANTIQLSAIDGRDDIDITITNDTKVKSIYLTNFRNVTISNCTNCTTINISGTKTKTISVTLENKNSALTSVSATVDNVTTINLSNNLNLKELKFNYTKTPTALTNLNLSYTNTESITWNNSKSGTLNLKPFTNLKTFNIQYNPIVQYIQFNNIQNSPFVITKAFTGCEKLQRVYGNLLIDVPSCFSGCSLFSIHGTNLSNLIFKGQKVLNENTIKTPYEILGDTTNSLPLSANLFQTGDNVTNITFSASNAGTSAYMETSCTIFDIYYVFYNIGATTTASSMFLWLKGNATYSQFGGTNYTTIKANSPNRYMFNKCAQLTSITWCFRNNIANSGNTGYNRILIYTVDGDKPGLFSPLVNLTSSEGEFYGSYALITDQHMFKNIAETDYAKLTKIHYMNNTITLVDNVNNLTEDGINKIISNNFINTETYRNNWGKFEEFFNYLPNIESLALFFNNTTYLQYPIGYNGKAGFRFPKKLAYISLSFRSSYATGILDFGKYWDDKDINNNVIRNITGSFRVANKWSAQTDAELCTLTIDNNLFERTPNLEYIGYMTTSDSVRDSILAESVSTKEAATFTGVTKLFGNINSFPYNIVKNLTKLKSFSCLFSGMTIPDSMPDVALPGDMFKNCKNLALPRAAFYNLYGKYSLTSNSFENCTNLQDVSYMFAKSNIDSLDRYNNQIHGYIPLKLFYHGTSGTTTTKVYGWYKEKMTFIDDQLTDWDEPDYIEITMPVLNSKITNISYCFQNNDILKPYNYSIIKGADNDSSDINDSYDPLINVELNPNYSPFDYIPQNNNFNIPVVNKAKDCAKYTFMWTYNGSENLIEILEKLGESSHKNEYSTIRNYYYPEDMLVFDTARDTAGYSWPEWDNNITTNFICAPDLLRYCANDTSTITNINGLFYYCGKTSFNNYTNGNSNSVNVRDWGIRGRIVPYLLHNLTNIREFQYSFKLCKTISSYKQIPDIISYYEYVINGKDVSSLITNLKEYYIPPSFFTKSILIIQLTEAFYNNIMSTHTDLSTVFKPLTGALTVTNIFYASYFPSVVSLVFKLNNITACKAAFAMSNNPLASILDLAPRTLKVTFSDVFKNYTLSKKGDANFQYVFCGYNSSTVTHESTPTLSTVVSDYNYWTY